ncbi:hypothetical protein CKAH01_16687 [Colletotrichum kahawae]|uniref:Uncharacterized protein n=1 Tax=Colletotrichum kahawae TaxID=34407 RepID=A0AAD9YF84_COLKA|nr:hypothetical protein CKAH01_16687 [Colletotrichum kahawae]
MDKTESSSNPAEALSPQIEALNLKLSSNSAPAPAPAPSTPKSPKHWYRSYGPLFKAYALALRSKISGAGDMYDDDKAFFTSTSMQRGVPLRMHEAYTNGRIFTLSDVIQNGPSPVLSEDGPSFVKYLERTDEEKLRIAEEKYRAIKREASLQFELAEFKWKEAQARDHEITLENRINKYGYDYLDACEERDLAKKGLRRAQQAGSRDVLRQKDLMESAVTSIQEIPGGTTFITKGEPPKDIVFRPLHVLSGFSITADHWADKGRQEERNLTELRIDLLEGFCRTWKELGFGQYEGSDKSYRKGSKDLERIRATIRDWKLVLRYTDLQAFEVNRGLWNISSFRTILPELARTAPNNLKNEVFQTTRVLLAYNADLVLRLPAELFGKLFPRGNNKAAENSDGRAKPTTSALEGVVMPSSIRGSLALRGRYEVTYF